MIDRLVSFNEQSVVAERRVTAGDPLLGDEGLRGPMLIEALAQTAACCMGLSRHGAAHLGYLVAAAGWKFHAGALPGDTVTLTATRVAALGALHRFAASASVGERQIASGSMTFSVEPASPASP